MQSIYTYIYVYQSAYLYIDKSIYVYLYRQLVTTITDEPLLPHCHWLPLTAVPHSPQI